MSSTSLQERDIKYKEDWNIHAEIENYSGYGDYDYKLGLYARHNKFGLIEVEYERIKKPEEKKPSLFDKALNKEPEQPPTVEEQIEKAIKEFKKWIDEEGEEEIEERRKDVASISDALDNVFPEAEEVDDPEDDGFDFSLPDIAHGVGVAKYKDAEDVPSNEADEDRRPRMIVHTEDNKIGRTLVPYKNLGYYKTEQIRSSDNSDIYAVDFNLLVQLFDVMRNAQEESDNYSVYSFVNDVLGMYRDNDMTDIEKGMDEIREKVDELEEYEKERKKEREEEEQESQEE